MALIRDGAQQFNGAPLAEVVDAAYLPLAERHGVKLAPLGTLATDAEPAHAYINHSRLIVDCPDCGGGEFVWRDGPHAMMCASCLNAAIGHRWRPIIVPKDLAAIEAVLEARTLPQHRNWRPGETLGALRAENIEHGEEVR